METTTKPQASNAWSALFEIRHEFETVFNKIKDNTAENDHYGRFQKIIEIVGGSEQIAPVFPTRKSAVNFKLNVQFFDFYMRKYGHKSMVDFYKRRQQLPALQNSRVEEFMPYVISAGDDVLAYFENMKIALEEKN